MTTHDSNNIINKGTSFYFINLELGKKLQDEEIINSFVKDKKTNCIKIELNHKYEYNTVIIPINGNNWLKFLESVEKRLKDKGIGISNEHVRLIKNVLDDNHEIIVGISDTLRDQTFKNTYNNEHKNELDQQQQDQQLQCQGEQEHTKDDDNTISSLIENNSVSQALRMHSEDVKIKGTIIGISRLFKMICKVSLYCGSCQITTECDFNPFPLFNTANLGKICEVCNKLIRNDNANSIEYKNAVIVELQGMETFNDMDHLSVFLFDSDTEGITVGESAIIKGKIHIMSERYKRQFPYLYAESIKYLNKENLTLTKLDIEAIKRFLRIKGSSSIIEALVSIFDPSIVGYEHVKKGLLMSAVNTSETASKKEKIHELLIGDPGLGKSKLVKRATELVHNSNNVSAQNASGKSLTAIIDKIDENTFLRLGPVPQARGANCGLNEIGRMGLEDQGHLLDVMEEEEFTKTAYGFHTKIQSPTTIIASANPINNSKWKDSDKIDLNEFPVLEPIFDRFDLKFAFRTIKDHKEIKAFGKKYSEILAKKAKRQLPDYTPFLVKYIEYARQLKPILNEEAITMLEEFYINIKIKGFGSERVLPTLHKLAKAIARLKLKTIADEEDAKEVMEFYNVMLVDFQKSVVVSQSPRDLAYNECVSILEQIRGFRGITLEDLFKKVCESNEQLANYFEYDEKPLRIKNNRKVRNVYEMLLNHSNIKKVQEKPIVLQWLDPTPSTKTEESIITATMTAVTEDQKASDLRVM
ncbi:MAG TPA: AAA family ATPase [Nitrososphaeraceae archaeon]|nr:AAA family ATPase [Nitrososphaeraceae archaeon]